MTLYLDDLAVHKTLRAKDLYLDLNIQVIYTAPYSPEYNPIEFLFSALK